MAAARDALMALAPASPGRAVDVGCGTGLHVDVLQTRGYLVSGVDYSVDQLRVAVTRLPVARGDARRLPFGLATVDLVVSMLTHTDIDEFDQLAAEAVRVLVPGGSLVYVGVHPCFVHPFAERRTESVHLHPGYRTAGWREPTPFTGDAVRRRVGVHHLPLAELLNALNDPRGRIEQVLEVDPASYPEVLAVRLRRQPPSDDALLLPRQPQQKSTPRPF
ncbi:MAG TPA: class I SAM-dependent methyltransferase [Pseudonocardiaceae bacterium]|nr:class I SAM-dependent methyltransferase [Pseudonocardiaceae bacterium]